MDKRRDHYVVECGECNQNIPLKPVSTVNGKLTSEQWPLKMSLKCPHCNAPDEFIPEEVRIANIDRVPLDRLPKLRK